jgi:PIN domain nuclease of toxin-antitoxin system
VIVLDTAALIFWTIDTPKLSVAAREAIEASDRRIVSSISIWELALKVKQRRIVLPISVEDYMAGLSQVPKLEILSVDAATWLASVSLPWEHKDPADRVIVASATQLDCPLVTSDRVIAGYYPKVVW